MSSIFGKNRDKSVVRVVFWVAVYVRVCRWWPAVVWVAATRSTWHNLLTSCDNTSRVTMTRSCFNSTPRSDDCWARRTAAAAAAARHQRWHTWLLTWLHHQHPALRSAASVTSSTATCRLRGHVAAMSPSLLSLVKLNSTNWLPLIAYVIAISRPGVSTSSAAVSCIR